MAYSLYLIARGKFKFEAGHLGAELLELVQQILPFFEDEACAKNKYTRWPFRGGLVASPEIRVVRTLVGELGSNNRAYREARVTVCIPIDCAVGIGTTEIKAVGIAEAVDITELEAVDIVDTNTAGVGGIDAADPRRIDTVRVGNIGGASVVKIGVVGASSTDKLSWHAGRLVLVAGIPCAQCQCYATSQDLMKCDKKVKR